MSYADTHLYRLGANYLRASGEQAAMPGEKLHARRRPGVRRALRRRPELLAQLARGSTEPNPELQGPGLEAGRGHRRPLRLLRGSRRLHQAGNLYRMFDEAQSRASRPGALPACLGRRGRRSRPDKSCTSSKPTRTTDRGWARSSESTSIKRWRPSAPDPVSQSPLISDVAAGFACRSEPRRQSEPRQHGAVSFS